ncbi:aldo/keto reductase [Bifidobacterium tibiigranuli]|jgi:diketogulonate reductase-like aldo/keto reductase|uniref:aldo/keto reductase n=1 Tax=Bifidobacterium tibiigranuli TaxID=2172043 RepID=UPI00235338E2|nr:aldo/keto reductase [Bifidobacterium tibiigranuli]MCI1210760.1 aldo/keto reductase [Bifidobacterium tibiigranuli]MCI1220849.1 aldo/keto reductase [Bifidobacterium tibiigranuli]MCI1232029.1 aldo/keto reductase [Bifidobacterium tibiigranuli]
MTSDIKNPTITLNNGVTIPQLGLGVFQTKSGKETTDAVREALQAGYRHIDTAAAYGNEESVGEGLRQSGLKRHDVFITTKLWNDDARAGIAKEAFYRSMEKLGTEYIDLYLIHWPVDGWEQAWETMAELYAERRVRAIGVSNFQPYHLESLLSISDTKPAVDQVESSPQFANQDVIDFTHANGINVEAYSPLGGTGGTLLSNPALASIAERYGKSPAQVVIRWHLQRGLIVIPKSTHAERIRQNFDVFDFQLTGDDMKAIGALNTDTRTGADPDNFNF